MANQGSDWGADDEDEGGSDDELALAGIEPPVSNKFDPIRDKRIYLYLITK